MPRMFHVYHERVVVRQEMTDLFFLLIACVFVCFVAESRSSIQNEHCDLSANFSSKADFQVSAWTTAKHSAGNVEVKLPQREPGNTRTTIMIGQQDWWPWQLPLSHSPKSPKSTRQQSDACFPGGWEKSRGRKAEGACLESFQESHQFHQSSLVICSIVSSSSSYSSRFYSLSANGRQKCRMNTTQIRWCFCCNVHIIYIFTFPFQIQPFLAATLANWP